MALSEYYKCIKDPEKGEILPLEIIDGGNPQKISLEKKSQYTAFHPTVA